jgi:hypothetical protein
MLMRTNLVCAGEDTREHDEAELLGGERSGVPPPVVDVVDDDSSETQTGHLTPFDDVMVAVDDGDDGIELGALRGEQKVREPGRLRGRGLPRLPQHDAALSRGNDEVME